MRTYILDLAGWITQRNDRIISIAAEIDKAIADEGGHVTGVIPIEIRVGSSCSGCERDDRREWTESKDHTCSKEIATEA